MRPTLLGCMMVCQGWSMTTMSSAIRKTLISEQTGFTTVCGICITLIAPEMLKFIH